MVGAFDVPARLAEGRAAADTAQAYVSASRLRGCAHPDLTRYPGQILDWYSMLDDLDLGALDADCQSLRAAAVRAASALNDVRGALVGLPGGWRGQGAASVTDFLAGHCDTAQRLVEALEISQSRCVSLRDELWSLVDRQVSATISIAEQGRPEWPAAARAVLAGDAGRGEAGEIVDSQVKPFVDRVIRDEWLVSMRSVADDVNAAYRVAIAQVGALGGLMFEVPGGFVPQQAAATPRESVRVPDRIAALREAVPTVAAVPPAVPGIPTTAPQPAARNLLDTIASGLPQPAVMPALGTGMPSPGIPALPDLGPTGSDGFPHNASRPVDIPELGVPRLGGSGEDDASEPLEGISAGETDSELPAEEEAATAALDGGEDEPHDDAREPDVPEPAAEAVGDTAPVSDCPQPATETEPAPAPPAAEPPPPASGPSPPEPAASAEPSPPTVPETPCEMAADELPQVGE